jgi:hypothetical protein
MYVISSKFLFILIQDSKKEFQVKQKTKKNDKEY